MSGYVHDTKAGKQISAWIVTTKSGKYVAKIQAYHSDSGRVLVNIFDAEHGFQKGSADGYGYDKLAAALSGLKVGKITLADHCGKSLKKPKGAEVFPRDFKAPKGYQLVNWSNEKNGYMDCYFDASIKGLEAHYNVFQAI